MSKELQGRWALVTGGSSGLGVDFARELAQRGAGIILTARREERLREVAAELEEAHGVETEVIPADLARPEAPAELKEEIRKRGRQVDILVNNAGFGIYGEFLDTDLDYQEAMLQVDIVAPTKLTHLFGREMVERGWGRILQVASIGSFQPSPTYSTYSASKSYLLSFSEALDFELGQDARADVSVTTVCPGVTETEFIESAGQERTWYQRLTMMDSPTVARTGIRALLKQRRSVITGLWNKLSIWGQRLMPRRLVVWVANLTMQESQG